ncbi:hypothetical protein [Pseudotabrizicola algicola]|uniref:Uncharacterized protein n=1 Tax=Pseudotabrizicola algicola TaxID=2709381 RepID=A0A6B3RR94_9RHOB|nr:hypothetical protein [Pseudotabrizicola algicola]NEX48670.1 hypothetical protein [Pseudotabrizicola algicola]
MLDGFIGLLTELNGRVSLFIIPVEKADEGLPWVEVLAAGLATIGSAAVALLILWLTIRAERNQRNVDAMKADAAMALATFSKISRYANIIYAVKNAIDEGVANVNAIGLRVTDPSQMVGAIPGKFVEPERLKSTEYSFLFTKKDFEVVGQIEDLESGAIHLISLVEEYGRRHAEMQNWLDTTPGVIRNFEGLAAADMVPVELKGKLDHRIAQLNIILAAILEVTENHAPSPVEVVRGFIDAARDASFKEYFPKLEYGM